MKDLDVLVGQMSTDILEHALRLEDIRLCPFLNWLTAHNGKIQTNVGVFRETGEDFKSELQDWLSSLSSQGALWEYRLIMDEIAWWRELDHHRLDMLLKSEPEQ